MPRRPSALRWLSVFALFASTGLAASPPLTADELRALARAKLPQALTTYRDFLRLPNDANNSDDILRLLDWLEPEFTALGLTTQRLPTAGSPLLFAEQAVSDSGPTVLIYLQADGQPVDPNAWDQADPFDPVVKEQSSDGNWHAIEWQRLAGDIDPGDIDPDWRIFARSAADSKGPMTQLMAALRILRQQDKLPAFNIKVIVDTEEELGSPHLADAVQAHRQLLAADSLLIFDGPPHASNKPTVTFGARGIAEITLTTYGPRVPQHSGHYGNFIANPAYALARLLASLKSADGNVLVDGFYDGIVIDDATAAILDRVPDDEAEILTAIGVAESEQVADSLQKALQYPSLNVRGLRSAWVGADARTIIPATATAELDLRLVVESDPLQLIDRVRRHIEQQGFHVLDRPPTDVERGRHARIVAMQSHVSYRAFRSPFDAPPGRLARAAMRHLHGEEPILIRTMGGSIPIAPFVETLGIPAAIVPTVNIDNNQHSPNENLRIGHFEAGIAILLSVLLQGADSAD